jgi:hypothetical protein
VTARAPDPEATDRRGWPQRPSAQVAGMPALPGSDIFCVDVAPTPVLARLEGLNQHMTSFVKVLGRVPSRRAVTAADMAAYQASAKVNPVPACLEALFAAAGRRRWVFDLVKMGACHVRIMGMHDRSGRIICARFIWSDLPGRIRFSLRSTARHCVQARRPLSL